MMRRLIDKLIFLEYLPFVNVVSLLALREHHFSIVVQPALGTKSLDTMHTCNLYAFWSTARLYQHKSSVSKHRHACLTVKLTIYTYTIYTRCLH